MPSVEAQAPAVDERESSVPAGSGGSSTFKGARLVLKVQDLLSGVEQVLKLEDFSRGDTYRD